MTNLTKLISSGALLVAMAAAALPAGADPQTGSVCLTRDADAAMISKIPVEFPLIASLEGLWGSAVVQVDVDERGAAHNAAIIESTGSPVLDAAALKNVLDQSYAPRVANCENTSGSYRVDVEFTPPQAGR